MKPPRFARNIKCHLEQGEEYKIAHRILFTFIRSFVPCDGPNGHCANGGEDQRLGEISEWRDGRRKQRYRKAALLNSTDTLGSRPDEVAASSFNVPLLSFPERCSAL